jgi:hypothetical protein
MEAETASFVFWIVTHIGSLRLVNVVIQFGHFSFGRWILFVSPNEVVAVAASHDRISSGVVSALSWSTSSTGTVSIGGLKHPHQKTTAMSGRTRFIPSILSMSSILSKPLRLRAFAPLRFAPFASFCSKKLAPRTSPLAPNP